MKRLSVAVFLVLSLLTPAWLCTTNYIKGITEGFAVRSLSIQ